MSRLFSKLLAARGLSQGSAEAEAFLHPSYEALSDPFLLPDMDKAVKRLLKAAKDGEKVLVYGDYDVDGVTASTIMAETLELIGISGVEVMLPDRFIDGYGMSERVVSRCADGGFSLVVTVDCGSGNGSVISELSSAGVDVIVTDHHEILGGVPKDAIAVVNPKRPDGPLAGGAAGGAPAAASAVVGEVPAVTAPWDAEGRRPTGPANDLRELCGAGVAFYVARALVSKGAIPSGREKWLLDLAAIGTICDSMVLTGDNRVICYYGLLVLGKGARVGLSELMRVSGTKTLNTEAIGFQIGPRLNAAGRMETAELSLKLLRTKSRTEAAELARELDQLNKERKKQQNEAVSGVAAKGVGDEPVIVVSGPWHEGILGIIAGRLTERYRRPSFVLSEDNLKGSGRSFGDFDLSKALEAVSDDLESGGGHAAACGLRVKEGGLEAFSRHINEYYKGLGLVSAEQEKYLLEKEDLSVEAISEFTLDFLEEMSALEPFGNGNPEPVFLLPDVTVVEVRKMGADEKHLRLTVRDSLGTIIKLVAFYARGSWFELMPGEKADIWINICANEWNGSVSVEGRILRVERTVEF